jgi:23S rRNA pseudouridine1911/1915/1917 synthase
MRWIVRPGDGATVGEILARAGADADAVSEGRVFVGRVRVRTSDERVHQGDEVSISAPQPGKAQGAHILLREGDLVAADKPAGVPTIADHGGAAHSLVAMVARTLAIDADRVHPTSRLDRDVSGVVVFALSRAVAERLQRARSEGRYERRYLAIAERPPVPDAGTWDMPIGRARDPRLRAAGGRDPVPATTRYAVTARAPRAAMLAVAPVTGRTHQIRVHASHAGVPLLGDRAYGGPTRVTLASGRVLEPGRIALHAGRVVVPGDRGEPLVAVSPVPVELESLWSALGGEPEAWEVSLACALD